MSDCSKFPKLTIMIPPLPPYQLEAARNGLRKTIRRGGFPGTLKRLTEDFFRWQDDPDSASAWRKKRATLLFSKKELEVITSQLIHKIIDDTEFLASNSQKPQKSEAVGFSLEEIRGGAECEFTVGFFSYSWDCPAPDPHIVEVESGNYEADYTTCIKKVQILVYFVIFNTFAYLLYWYWREERIPRCST